MERRATPPQMTDSPPRHALLAGLDREPPTRGGAFFLLVTAALLWFCLRYSLLHRFLLPVFSGPAASRLARDLGRFEPGQFVANILLALAVGALSGAAVRRLKWLVAPCIILAIASGEGLLWLAFPHRPTALYSGLTLVGYQFRIGGVAILHLVSVLAFAGLGGALSSAVFRRLQTSVVAAGALAWVVVTASWLLFHWLWSTQFPASEFGARPWDIRSVSWELAQVLPYLVAAIWLVWATGGRGLWTAALITGGFAAFQVLTGGYQIITGNALKDFLESLQWTLRALAVASVGAWLGVLLLGVQRSRTILRDVIIIVGIVVAVAVVAALAEKQPSALGVRVPVSGSP